MSIPKLKAVENAQRPAREGERDVQQLFRRRSQARIVHEFRRFIAQQWRAFRRKHEQEAKALWDNESVVGIHKVGINIDDCAQESARMPFKNYRRRLSGEFC